MRLNRRLKSAQTYEWTNLRDELWLLWYLDGWFWYNVSAARWLAGNWYSLRNDYRWCKMLDRHVCEYMPGCRYTTTKDREAIARMVAQLRANRPPKH